ncbi:Pol polyprotein [Plakobranchus ocellatus]|uniref:Pol polyprotein n=1 Tax=Plakobranchus ocellatus TaxID=259542 RepID=A0AAV4DJX3_9GAST|nr:Pol polyprotein [Plakobranchus ocellatus]
MVILEEGKISGCKISPPPYDQSHQRRKRTRRKCLGRSTGFGGREESKAFGGHLGFYTTEENIFSRVWWPSICKDLRKYKYIKASNRSQPRVPLLQKRSEQLHPVDIPPYPWSLIGVDIHKRLLLHGGRC